MIVPFLVLIAAFVALLAALMAFFAKRSDQLLVSLAISSFALCAVVIGFGSRTLGLVLSLVFLCTDLAIYFFARASQLSSSSAIADKNKYFGSRVMALAYAFSIGAGMVWGIWNLPTETLGPVFKAEAVGGGAFFEKQIWTQWFLFVAVPALTVIGSVVAGFLLIRRKGWAE